MTICRGETETDYIYSNLPDGFEQGIEDGGVPDDTFWTIWMSGNKDKQLKETIYFIYFFCRYFSPIQLLVRPFLISRLSLGPVVQWERLHPCSYLGCFECISLQKHQQNRFLYTKHYLDVLCFVARYFMSILALQSS